MNETETLKELIEFIMKEAKNPMVSAILADYKNWLRIIESDEEKKIKLSEFLIQLREILNKYEVKG